MSGGCLNASSTPSLPSCLNSIVTKGWPSAYGTPNTASMKGGTSLVAVSLSASSSAYSSSYSACSASVSSSSM